MITFVRTPSAKDVEICNPGIMYRWFRGKENAFNLLLERVTRDLCYIIADDKGVQTRVPCISYRELKPRLIKEERELIMATFKSRDLQQACYIAINSYYEYFE